MKSTQFFKLSSIFSDVNLSVIDEYKKQFPDINIGYSGHELGFIPTLGAIAKGVKGVIIFDQGIWKLCLPSLVRTRLNTHTVVCSALLAIAKNP